MIRLAALFLALALPATAQTEREGWIVVPTATPYDQLVEEVRAAIRAAPINIVTQASASDGARGRGIDIPGNRVIGVYRNDYAVRMLEASVAAGIEAPLVLYVTETDGGATLSYKTASHVFAPYMDEGGQALKDLATELDAVLEGIAATIR